MKQKDFTVDVFKDMPVTCDLPLWQENVASFSDKVSKLELFTLGPYCTTIGRSLPICQKVLYENFSTFVVNIIMKGVIACPAPFTMLESDIDEYMSNIGTLKLFLPAKIVSVIDSQERNYDEALQSPMDNYHCYFLNEYIRQEYVPLGDFPLWPNYLPPISSVDPLLPAGVISANSAIDVHVDRIVMEPRNIIFYSLNSDYISVEYDGLRDCSTKVIVEDPRIDKSSEYVLPVWDRSDLEGFSVVYHSSVTMYPMYFINSPSISNCKRVVVYRGNSGYRTVFDYGGYNESKYLDKLFPFPVKVRGCDIYCDPVFSVYSPYYSDHEIRFPWVGVTVKMKRLDHILWLNGDTLCDESFTKDGDCFARLRSIMTTSNFLYSNLNRSITYHTGVFCDRLQCVHPNPGPMSASIYFGCLMFVVIVHMLSASLELYILRGSITILPLVCIISCGVIIIMGTSALCCGRRFLNDDLCR